uniref:Uncharacterized protein n=1 Tax=Aegilops tauschii subsp. strangulata TaxID=200361 RepID=A0A453DCK2_AEGTS
SSRQPSAMRALMAERNISFSGQLSNCYFLIHILHAGSSFLYTCNLGTSNPGTQCCYMVTLDRSWLY